MAHLATKDHKNQPPPSHPYLWTTIYGHVRQVTAGTMPTSVAFSATCGHCVVQAQTSAEGHIWVCSSIAVMICNDVQAPGYLGGRDTTVNISNHLMISFSPNFNA